MERVFLTTLFMMTLLKCTFSLMNARSCVSLASSGLPQPTMINMTLKNHVFLRTDVAGAYWCARRCMQQHRCKSFNFHVRSNTCQLSEASARQHTDDVEPAPGFIYYDRDVIPTYFLGACEGHDCHPEAICQPTDSTNYTCKCQNPALGGNNCTAVYDTDTCSDNPCGNFGTCVEEGDGYHCICAPGFTGHKCDTILCNDYNNRSMSPHVWTPEVEVVWQNEAGTNVDVYLVPISGQERFAFSVPAAADRTWPAPVEHLWVARDHDSQALLLVNGDCSFVVPQERNVSPVITSN